MRLVALGFERRTMTFRAGVVIAHTHHRGGGIVSAFTRCGVAFRFSVLGQSHVASVTAPSNNPELGGKRVITTLDFGQIGFCIFLARFAP